MGRIENGTLIHLEIRSTYNPTLPLRLIEFHFWIYRRYGAILYRFYLGWRQEVSLQRAVSFGKTSALS
ncbi:MAG: hypothetical protein NZ850_03690 [Caldimicrobium sp.]|nr:hypothetical protein [Caldimicrobium sp.]